MSGIKFKFTEVPHCGTELRRNTEIKASLMDDPEISADSDPSPPAESCAVQVTVSMHACGSESYSRAQQALSFDAGYSHDLRGWCKRDAAGTRGKIIRGGTRRARADSDRHDPGHWQLLPTAQATPPRLPLLFSWARGRLPCVCVSTSSTFAKCALKALGAFFCIEYVHARFLG